MAPLLVLMDPTALIDGTKVFNGTDATKIILLQVAPLEPIVQSVAEFVRKLPQIVPSSVANDATNQSATDGAIGTNSSICT